MKKMIAITLFGSALILGACERTPVQPAVDEAAPRQTSIAAPAGSTEMTQQLAAVRLATRRYNDINTAVAEGYIPLSPCVAHPQLGGMGIHYGKPSQMGDAEYSPTDPDILLYVPQADGSLKLLGVEYWITEDAWKAAGKSGVPMFVDHPFDYDPANDHGMPARYTLHVWTWHANPSGIFAPFNPRVSCPAEQAPHQGAHANH